MSAILDGNAFRIVLGDGDAMVLSAEPVVVESQRELDRLSSNA